MDTNTIYGIIHLVCAVWVIYEVWVVNKKMSEGGKLLWTILALLFSIITAIVYYFTQKNNL